MTAAVSFAEQDRFAAVVEKEKASAEWARQQNDAAQRQHIRRRVGKRRTRDGRELFVVTFFDGLKFKRIDWLAMDAKYAAACGERQDERGTRRHKQRQSDGIKKSRSAPCLDKRDETELQDRENFTTPPTPFQVVFPLPPKGAEMRKRAAREQAGLFDPRPETVALSATEKREMRTWGVDVDAIEWPDGMKPPPWVKAVGNTTNKWANKEIILRAAREEQDFVDKALPSSSSQRTTHAGAVPPAPTQVPWVRELPPVRDGRKQLASRSIIPFLDQHMYPAGGVAEVKRARRREKEAFLRTVTKTKIVPRNTPRKVAAEFGCDRARDGAVVGRESWQSHSPTSVSIERETIAKGVDQRVDGLMDSDHRVRALIPLVDGQAARDTCQPDGEGGKKISVAFPISRENASCAPKVGATTGEPRERGRNPAARLLVYFATDGTDISEAPPQENAEESIQGAMGMKIDCTREADEDSESRLTADIAEVLASTGAAERLVAFAGRNAHGDNYHPDDPVSLGSLSSTESLDETRTNAAIAGKRAQTKNVPGSDFLDREVGASDKPAGILEDDLVNCRRGEEEEGLVAGIRPGTRVPSFDGHKPAAVVTSSISVRDMGEMPI